MPHSSDPAQPCVYAVTPCHNGRALTLRFISQFAQLSYPNKRLVLVDDGSSDGTADAVAREHPWVELIRHPRERGDLWWAGATNLGVLYGLDRGAEYILTINDDATFGPEWLDRLIAMAIAVSGEDKEHDGRRAALRPARTLRPSLHGEHRRRRTDRRVTTALTWLLLLKYGYLVGKIRAIRFSLILGRLPAPKRCNALISAPKSGCHRNTGRNISALCRRC